MADDVPCPLCENSYHLDLYPCLHKALARIASLEARLRTSAQKLIACVGAEGPCNAEAVAAWSRVADALEKLAAK